MTYRLVADLAEHVPGTPDRYRHGWVKITQESVRLVKERKALHAELVKNGYPETTHPLHDVVNDGSKLYKGKVATARDSDGRIVGMFSYESKHREGKGDGISGVGMRVADIAKGQGVGRQLIDSVRDEYPDEPLSVYNTIQSAREFYKKTGATYAHEYTSIAEYTKRNARKKVDLAEHVPGTPDHFKHDWIPIAPTVKAKRVRKPKTRAQIHAAAVAKQWNREHKPDAANVVDMWNQATPEEKEDGLNWYKDANFTAQALAAHSGMTINQAAGILAVYSPQTPWATNMQRAARVIRTRTAIGGKGSGIMATTAQKTRAERILGGEKWQDVLTGRKIRNFASLIEHGQDDDPAHPKVVVDRHALSVASGARASEGAYAFSKLGTKGKYEKVSKVFADAAVQLSKQEGHPVSAHQVQAVTWLTRQRLNQAGTVGRRGAAKQAETAWKVWKAEAAKYYPELLGKEATTGYKDLPEDIQDAIQLAIEFGEFDEMDLANPQITGATDPNATATVQTPPDEDTTTQKVVEILLAGYALKKTADLLSALIPSISPRIFMLAIGSSGGMTGHRAHARLQSAGLNAGTKAARVATNAATSEVFYRAAYLVRAAERIATDMANGASAENALDAEKPIFAQHEAARRGRLDAATNDARHAAQYGDLLGWYLDPSINNEAECIAADGNNYYADQGTVIGRPGSVHPNCGCVSGPPIEGGGMVNDAVNASAKVIFMQPRKFGLAPQRKVS